MLTLEARKGGGNMRPAIGAIVGPLAPMLLNVLAGIFAGAVAFVIVAGIKRLRARGAAATGATPPPTR